MQHHGLALFVDLRRGKHGDDDFRRAVRHVTASQDEAAGKAKPGTPAEAEEQGVPGNQPAISVPA